MPHVLANKGEEKQARFTVVTHETIPPKIYSMCEYEYWAYINIICKVKWSTIILFVGVPLYATNTALMLRFDVALIYGT